MIVLGKPPGWDQALPGLPTIGIGLGQPYLNLITEAYAFWRLDETEGTTAYDSSGNGRSAVFKGTGQRWGAGKFLSSIDLNGSGWLNAGAIADWDSDQAFTVSAWVKYAQNTNRSIVTRMSHQGPYYEGWRLFNSDAAPSGRWAFDMKCTGGGALTVYGTDIDDNTWHLLVATYDGSRDSSGLQLYLDGSPDAGRTVQSNSLTTNTIVNANKRLRIGSLESFSDPNNDDAAYYVWIGGLDEVGLWTRVLTAEEVAVLYAGPLPGPPPIQDSDADAIWHMNEGSGQTINDSSGNGYNATTGATPTWIAGKVGSGAVEFSVPLYDFSAGDVLDKDKDDAFSIAVWVKTGESGGQPGVVTKVSGASTSGYRFHAVQAGVTGAYFGLFSTTTGNSIQMDSDNAVNDDAWHHIVITYDGSADASGVKMYTDSLEDTPVTLANSLTGSTVGSSFLRIGSYAGASFYNGDMDEPAIYPFVLTQEQINYLYSLGSP